MVHVLRVPIGIAGIGLSVVVFAASPVRAGHSQAAAQAAPAQSAPSLYVGDRKIRVPAFVDHGRLLVPVRGVFEAIGASVQYSWPNFVVIKRDDIVIAAFIMDRRRALVGRSTVELDVAPLRRNGLMYVPLRVVAEAAGATVSYTGRPAVVRIKPPVSSQRAIAERDASQLSNPSTAQWRIGVAILTGLCLLGCLVVGARRFVPAMQQPQRRQSAPPAPEPEPEPEPLEIPLPDRVALTSVEAMGEARFRKEVVTETRTIHVPVTREELVIEYAGDGGTVIIQGRELEAGETVRIPLWEERVHVDVTKHVLVKEDIVVDKRLSTFAAPVPAAAPPPGHVGAGDFAVVEGSPS